MNIRTTHVGAAVFMAAAGVLAALTIPVSNQTLNLFVNPVAIGKGMRIFAARRPLKLTTSTAYSSGIVVNTYEPQ